MKIWIDESEVNLNEHQLFDCRNMMDQLDKSIKQYEEQHIIGAVFVPGYPVLYERNKPEEGRHPLPDIQLFKAFVDYFAEGRTPVCYDEYNGFMATRFFFLCDITGIPCHILNKPFDELSFEKTSGKYEAALIEQLDISAVSPDIDQQKVAARAEVEDAHNVILIDARDNQRFLGESEPIDIHPGRIPGAVNHPFKEVTEHIADQDFSTLEPIANPAIVYCGSGLSATPVYTALRAMDKEVKLYTGSYSEWIYHHPERIERG